MVVISTMNNTISSPWMILGKGTRCSCSSYGRNTRSSNGNTRIIVFHDVSDGTFISSVMFVDKVITRP